MDAMITPTRGNVLGVPEHAVTCHRLVTTGP